ncbi:MAG: hypothetical protein QOI60_866 [Actinomycetota bacterium]|nr:hypothetical protein [Actinomycetota bacterium]
MAVRPGDPALYIAEKTGRVVAIRGGAVNPVPVLDLSSDVSLGGEQGLLGLTFSPDGGFLYVNFTDTNGDTRIDEFAMRGDRADEGSRRQVLFVQQPYDNHNGGNLVFGPDGYLYIGMGDGGSGGDPQNRAQTKSELLGKMLRISPRPSGGRPYGIPPDNPFVDEPSARPEVWAYGLRNPWRFSFDSSTGALWIGDVGQSSWEEIDTQPAGSRGGQNYGWNRQEGAHPYSGSGSPAGTTVSPVFEYPHTYGRCAVTGGYVYRGQDIPGLAGTYVFADFCRGELQGLRLDKGTVADQWALGPTVPNLSSFGQDASGELYVLSLSAGVYRLAPG